MAENAMEKVVAALATIQSYAVREQISIEVELETAPHPKLINGPRFPTGREVLVIRVPYDRNEPFLREQLERMREQRAKLAETMALADTEIAELESELDSSKLGEPKQA